MISFAKVTAEVYAGLTPVEDRVYYITDTGEMFLNGVKYGGGDQAQADWDQSDSTAVDYIKDKPALAAVATTGSYYSLTNRPYVPNATGGWFGIWHDQADSTATTITLSVSGTNARANTFQYCNNINTNNWTDYTLGTAITLTQYQYVLWRNKDSAKLLGNATGHYVFTITGGGVYLSGNIMSLKDKGMQYNDFCAAYDFYEMFKDCTAIKDASMLEMPASVANSYSCYGMFNGCTGMVRGPAILPATTLGGQCYRFMFNNCTSLVKAPELPATALASMCYHYMFAGCTSLTETPYLPATTVPSLAYNFMYQGCTNLRRVRTAATTLGADNSQSWMTGVAASGVIECPSALDISTRGADTAPTGWTIVRTDQPHADWDESDSTEASYIRNKPAISGGGGDADYLCFTALEASSTISMGKNYTPPVLDLEYSKDKNTWTPYESGDIITLSAVGDSVWIRGDNERTSSGLNVYNYFIMTGKIDASGKITSLIDKTCSKNNVPSYCYNYLFKHCTSLVKAPDLPAITLADNCYMNMFQGCTSLVKAPDLPAITLANNCYRNMFQGCTSLVKAPHMLATTLANYCCDSMFNGCTSLKTAPDLPAITLAGKCYNSMFQGCTSLVKAPDLPATTLASDCYRGMFSGCTSLKTAPDLPATALVDTCYYNMFQGCTYLVKAPDLPATTLKYYCYYNMFNGCTSLVNAPELPATSLNTNCYGAMFKDCTSLMYLKLNNCNTTDILSGVTTSGVLVAPDSLDVSGFMPATWTKVDAANTPDDGTTSEVEASSGDTFAVCPGEQQTGVITVASALTLTAMAAGSTDIAYAEVVIDLAVGATVTAGSNLTLVDAPTAGKRNVCVVRWQGGTARLYVVDVMDIPA